MVNDPRLVLERLCAERGEDFAGLSRMLGRNAAYIQQYVRRGVPRRLGEDERRKLARYFGVPEALLGGPPEDPRTPRGLLSVKRHPVMVSAGPGAIVTEALGKPYFAFDERWLKALTASSPSSLSIVRVEGDSMAPTLNAGDDILVDLGDLAERLRDYDAWRIPPTQRNPACLAEREGFEPSTSLTTRNGFRDRRIRPLCHLSGQEGEA